MSLTTETQVVSVKRTTPRAFTLGKIKGAKLLREYRAHTTAETAAKRFKDAAKKILKDEAKIDAYVSGDTWSTAEGVLLFAVTERDAPQDWEAVFNAIKATHPAIADAALAKVGKGKQVVLNAAR